MASNSPKAKGTFQTRETKLQCRIQAKPRQTTPKRSSPLDNTEDYDEVNRKMFSFMGVGAINWAVG